MFNHLLIISWQSRHILDIASAAGVETADYFLAMLDASTIDGENIEKEISTFTRFFRDQKTQQTSNPNDWLENSLLGSHSLRLL
jgi:hypothetical protein